MSGIFRTSLAALLMLSLAAGAVHASPKVDLNTEAEWSAAPVEAVTSSDWTTLLTNNSGFDAEYPGDYDEPTLGVTTASLYVLDGGEKIDSPGLVMGWGDAGIAGDYTGAWKYVYPADPNVAGQTITAGLIAPQWAANGVQMNSIAIGLMDAGGLLRTWTWLCAVAVGPANTIAWNRLYNVTIGPISVGGPDPGNAVDAVLGGAAIPAIYWSQAGFNPATVTWILGIENGNLLNVAAQAPVPPGGFANMAMWNWWQNLVVTPEPASLSLLALGALLVLARRRRK